MILLINACVRSDSRTKQLADHLISKMNDKVKEVKLEDISFPKADESFLKKRDMYASSGDFSADMFQLARDFASAEEIIVSAPLWDLSFPAVLKQYFEQINVVGLTFRYNENGIPVGLCKAKRLFYVTTAGGRIFNEEYGYGYIKALAECFYGIKECVLFKAEELDIIGADTASIIERAKAEIDQFIKQ